ncbi:hypothetical protein IM40_08575 [Candidatus Paracaedimonas acanthamoebae]|nr:hypothetical protein IM40_08575 [Candidatus Paracaedimonas acanthamoebae]
MLKIYTSFALVSSIITMLSTQAFCTNVLSFSDEDHGSNGHNYSKIVVSTNKIELLNSNTLTSDEFEDMHQDLFKKQDFNGAAIALIGAAITGHTENMDYLLTLEPNALQFIRQSDETIILKIVASISYDLAKQFKMSQSKPKSEGLLPKDNYFTEVLSRK